MPDRPLLPLLQPFGWVRSATISRPFRVAGRDIGSLAFGWDQPDVVELADEGDPEDLEIEALANLCRRTLSWELVEPRGESAQSDVLVCAEDYFAAEKVLDKAFLRAAQNQLGTTRLAVGVPCRGVLMATSAAVPEAELSRFARWVTSTYLNADRPLTHLTLLAADGRMDGLHTAEPTAVTSSFIMEAPRQDGGYDIVLSTGIERPDELEAELYRKCWQVWDRHRRKRGFSGELTVRLDPDTTPDTEAVRTILAALPEAFAAQLERRSNGDAAALSIWIDERRPRTGLRRLLGRR